MPPVLIPEKDNDVGYYQALDIDQLFVASHLCGKFGEVRDRATVSLVSQFDHDTLWKNHHTRVLASNDTISNIKDMIQDEEEIPLDQQKADFRQYTSRK